MDADTGIVESGPAPAGENWSARKLRPATIVAVAGIFLAFMALAHFVFHSADAVKALGIAAVGGIAPLLLELGKRYQYRIVDGRLERRILIRKKPQEFKPLFRLDDLDRIQPVRDGFKYYKPIHEQNPLRRFWKAHVTDAYSGEVRVEPEDRQRVLDEFARRGISVRPGRR